MKRASNLDLLRIISMLLIILLHSIDHSGVLEASESVLLPIYAYVRFSYALAQVCVNCYVLISGYFLVNSKFRLQKLVALYLEVVFYSVVIKTIFMLTGDIPFSLLSLVGCFIPVLTGRYWFITIYFGMYLIAPFLNIAIHAMNRKQHTSLNVLLFILFSFPVTIYPSFAGMNSNGGWGLAWFVILYFIGSWFQLYYQPSGKKAFLLATFFFIPILVSLISVVGKGFDIGIISRISDNWYRYDSIPAYIATISLFVLFLNVNIKANNLNRLITWVAPSTLGVYLIHAHANLSPWLWDLLNLPKKLSSFTFPLVQIGVVATIYIICTLIDIVRNKIFGRFEKAAIVFDTCEYFSNVINKLIDRAIY